MNSRLTQIVAQQHIADLHRVADHNRLVHAARATSSDAVTGPRHAATVSVAFLRRLRRRLV